MSIYEINNKPTVEKIEKYNEDRFTFFRYQMKDWEMGAQSWGMIYSTAEEAIENCEDDGLTEDEAVLDGKSACNTAQELFGFSSMFDKDFRVLVLSGKSIGTGHDGEEVVDVDEILEIWDYEEFDNLMMSLED
jgi:hypothetical protein